MKIKFTNTMNVPEEFTPKPASQLIPDWYKKMESYIGGEKVPNGEGQTSATIKKCMPVFDALTNGYIITTPCDVWVKQIPVNIEIPEVTQPFYEWSNFGIIQFHPVEQAPIYPNNTGHTVSYPKWLNPWSIQTPKGYSCLFVAPFHRKTEFTILPGIVDTDGYYAPVNFPFVLTDIKFEGLIPAGTPMAQVIPFKRETWKSQFGKDKDIIAQSKISILLRTKFFDSYKNKWWSKKEHK